MTSSDWINVVLCILSFILASISVVTVVISIRQNQKMIKNSTRPYVVLTGKTTNFQDIAFYLVLKNYGKTAAFIKSIKWDLDLQKYSYIQELPYRNIENTMLAPGQSIICNINGRDLSKDKIKDFSVTIEYSDGVNNYNEKNLINFKALIENVTIKATTEGKELKIISYTLQDLVEKEL